MFGPRRWVKCKPFECTCKTTGKRGNCICISSRLYPLFPHVYLIPGFQLELIRNAQELWNRVNKSQWHFITYSKQTLQLLANEPYRCSFNGFGQHCSSLCGSHWPDKYIIAGTIVFKRSLYFLMRRRYTLKMCSFAVVIAHCTYNLKYNRRQLHSAAYSGICCIGCTLCVESICNTSLRD